MLCRIGLCVVLTVLQCWAQAGPAEEVAGILSRLLGPERAALFEVSVDASISTDGKDAFTLSKAEDDNVVRVAGSSGVAAAWGAHHYLTHHCGAHISWDGDQLNLPSPLPAVNQSVSSLDKYKYYQNVCTSSYSFVWWDWPRWEREIDWMALKGINLALAFGGQEAIWRRVFDGLGVIEDNFTGPAFLAWGRMGNIRGFGGGLGSAWHARSVALQHRVLDRMRALGITPVLPAFNGILPPSFRHAFPEATGTNISRWNSFPDEYSGPFLLDPVDLLFPVVSRLFLREYIAEFGTDHIYNSDTFNENDPDSGDPAYLAATGRAIYEGILEADPAAVWMVQGWMFLSPFWGPEQVKAYVTSVPIGSMLILDLQSDLTPFYQDYESYYGQPFIWCTLHNFGGQLGMYGHLEKVNKGIVRGRTFPNSTMVGVGITPEGIDQNYIMYDLTLNGTLQETERNLTEWVAGYARRRYGFENADVEAAWQILRQTTYDYNLERRPKEAAPYGDHIAKNILTKLPTLRMNEVSWYEKREVLNAFKLLVNATTTDPALNASSLFRHDLVDTARQVVQLAVGLLYQTAVVQYRAADVLGFSFTSLGIVNILDGLDGILRTDSKFLLGTWLEGAKAAAQTPEEAVQFEWNARNQITLWGPKGEIRDYAAKQWAGMVSDFYKPRWVVFLDALLADLHGTAPYNRTAVNEDILNKVEIPFTYSQTRYPTQPDPDTVGTVLRFYQAWATDLESIYADDFMPTVVGYSDMQKQKNRLL